MKVGLFLACARLCTKILGYEAYVPINLGDKACACVDIVERADVISPFTAQYARTPKPAESETDDRAKMQYEVDGL